MRVLLDECVPRALREQLPGHEVKTVAESGWAGVKNGELLRLAALQPLMSQVLAVIPTAARGKLTNIRG